MVILSIETSCDETAVSVVRVTGEFPHATYELLGNALSSQAKLHQEYGGVFPNLAKREHAKTLVPMLQQALAEAEILESGVTTEPDNLSELLVREPALAEALQGFFAEHGQPEVDVIAVTSGPGLEPALWVGVNFAKALALAWQVPVIPVDHMEGHVLASVFDVERDDQLAEIAFPAISLLISGGHTELVLMQDWGQYEKVGQTRDDAVGEAFDKVARLMGLPYPGGPEISKLARQARAEELPPYKADLPRPMLRSGDLDFSFSGLKTAVRYAVADQELTDTDKAALARDFEDVVAEVLVKKTAGAVEQHQAKTLIIGGGVSANQHLRHEFHAFFGKEHPEVTVYFPDPTLATDNSVMIALAGHAKLDQRLAPKAAAELIRADGNRSLS
jgi:N6-L-threonylcarbamoyladenine synthase